MWEANKLNLHSKHIAVTRNATNSFNTIWFLKDLLCYSPSLYQQQQKQKQQHQQQQQQQHQQQQ